jgi:hypothetical protein
MYKKNKTQKIFGIKKKRNNKLKGVIKSILCTWGTSIGFLTPCLSTLVINGAMKMAFKAKHKHKTPK